MFESESNEPFSDNSSEISIKTKSTVSSSISDNQKWTDTLSEEDIIETENLIYELIGDYLNTELEFMYSPYFNDKMVSDITDIVEEQLYQSGLYTKHNSDVESFVNHLCDNFFVNNILIPPRSYNKTFIISKLSFEDIILLQHKLDKLRSVIQPKQKTEEWYAYRKEIITASNIWKIFGSDCQRNSLIYEKCCTETVSHNYFTGNTNSPLNWGNKYEPLSIMLYEKIYNTKVEEFGCITHRKYPFIGASPDGINVDIMNGRYGRMIEVKNIFNRDITGVPKLEYWIQMQIQMETCDLEECDFIETRFKECNTEEEFYMLSDKDKDADPTCCHKKGVVLYFTQVMTEFNNVSYVPHYVFMPLDVELNKETIDGWIQNKKKELADKYILFKTSYWYLDEISVVLVKRNKEWFERVVSKIKDCWDIIVKERVEGYEHRNVKKNRTQVINDENSTNKIISNLKNTNNVLLVKLEE